MPKKTAAVKRTENALKHIEALEKACFRSEKVIAPVSLDQLLQAAQIAKQNLESALQNLATARFEEQAAIAEYERHNNIV